MLTKKFYAYMRAFMQSVSCNFVLTDGSVGGFNHTQMIQSACRSPFVAIAMYSPGVNSAGVYFGTGTTAPTVDDYCLENPIVSELTVTTPSAVTYNRTSDYEEYTVTFGVTTNNTVTITEIGLKCHVYSYNSDSRVIMIDRTILNNPIEILAGESKQITYTIRFNYPDK